MNTRMKLYIRAGEESVCVYVYTSTSIHNIFACVFVRVYLYPYTSRSMVAESSLNKYKNNRLFTFLRASCSLSCDILIC